jgi:hypothetical protein
MDQYTEAMRLVDEIKGLATPENLGDLCSALIVALGQVAVAGGVPGQVIVAAVVKSYNEAALNPEDGADEFRLLLLQRMAC